MDDDYQKKSVDLAFDITKQFLTLAFAGIAFVVGLSFNNPGSVSTLLLWIVLITFSGSAIFGLLFLMRGVNLLSVERSFDIYTDSLRILSGLQIVLVLLSVLLLIPVLNGRSKSHNAVESCVEIKLGGGGIVSYPIDPRGMRIELDGEKVKVTPATSR